jgi:hypothetical protein
MSHTLPTALITVHSPGDDGYELDLSLLDGGGWTHRARSTLPHPLPEELTAGGDHTTTARRLGELLWCDTIRAELHEIQSMNSPLGVRLLLDVRDPHLARLPWEAMQSFTGPGLLFTNKENPCARIRAPERAATARQSDHWPILRVLVVVGVDPALSTWVQAGRELEGVSQALARYTGFVDREVLVQPGRPLLTETYERLCPHIFHYIGDTHRTDSQHALAFGAPGTHANSWSWSPQMIVSDLASWRPRLVFLNACNTDARRNSDGAWHVADAFAELEVPAILAMRGPIDGAAAATFGSWVYTGLAQGLAIDAAVSQARNVLVEDGSWSDDQASVPRLTLDAELPEYVLPNRFAVDAGQRRQIRASYKPLHTFVDHIDARRKLWKALGEGRPGESGSRVVAVLGDDMTGKSSLVKWCLGTLALRGRNVGYVEMPRLGVTTSLELLGAIAEALTANATHGNENTVVFDAEYLEVIERELLTTRLEDPDGASPRYRRRLEPGPEDGTKRAFEIFHSAVAAAAADDDDAIVVLDRLDGIQPGAWRAVREHLFDRVLKGGPMRLVVVSDEDTFERHFTEAQRARIERIPLEEQPAADYPKLAAEYLEACGVSATHYQQFIDTTTGDVEADLTWTTETFLGLDIFMRHRYAEEHDW